MSASFTDDPTLDELIDAVYTGDLDAEGWRRLNAKLADDEDAQRRYVQYLMLCDAMRRRFDPPEQFDEPIEVPTPRRHSGLPRGVAIAAAVAFAAALWFVIPALVRDTTNTDTLSDRPVATVIAGQSAFWQGQPVNEGQELAAGHLAFDSGSVELYFRGGGTVQLEGPAEIDLISDDTCRLLRGQLVANIPPRAVGFTVLAAGHRVVDLGTRFYLRVDNFNAAQLGVLEGHVSVRSEAGDGTPIVLDAGASGYVDATTRRFHVNPSATLDYVASTSVLIDFTDAPTLAAHPARGSSTFQWNTIDEMNGSRDELVDIDGRSVAVGVNSSGFTGSHDNGARNAAIDWADPLAAAGMWGIFVATSDSDLATVELSNLLPGRSYDISLASARSKPPEPRSPGARQARYAIAGAADTSTVFDAYLSGWGDGESLRWNGVTADDQGRITIRLTVTHSLQCAYINAIRIEGPMRIVPRFDSLSTGGTP